MEIKAQMKPKWRYNANLAIKKGVMVSRTGMEKIGVFYELLKETAVRDGISIHNFDYYKALFDFDWYDGVKPDIRLYLAEHEGDLLAGIITLLRGREAFYLYGASSGIKRNLMAPYTLQLKAMEDAKLSGCLEYDLYGIPPNKDPDHPMAGLYRFKTGFGGSIIKRAGCWDYPYRTFDYRFFRFADYFRRKLKKFFH
jgi:lipid II:glycine glycyltransferase (peptidoglycan interpeptide bridge formation enzyme)